mmetsp:Transcript_82711/g.246699  ORF Transcript_82711/g.246699 Transcript_82711/m.246699 type:complete len:276 (-) Transcript_82711:218-1045(-)
MQFLARAPTSGPYAPDLLANVRAADGAHRQLRGTSLARAQVPAGHEEDALLQLRADHACLFFLQLLPAAADLCVPPLDALQLLLPALLAVAAHHAEQGFQLSLHRCQLLVPEVCQPALALCRGGASQQTADEAAAALFLRLLAGPKPPAASAGSPLAAQTLGGGRSRGRQRRRRGRGGGGRVRLHRQTARCLLCRGAGLLRRWTEPLLCRGVGRGDAGAAFTSSTCGARLLQAGIPAASREELCHDLCSVWGPIHRQGQERGPLDLPEARWRSAK